MSIDIENVERLLLFYYKRDKLRFESVAAHFLALGLLGCLLVMLFGVLTFREALLIETLSIYHVFFVLLPMPIFAVLSVKYFKHTMNSFIYEKISNKLTIIAEILFAIGLFFILFRDRLPLSQEPLYAGFALYAIITMTGPFAVSGRFYMYYLARKYARYFKDERLRPPENDAAV